MPSASVPTAALTLPAMVTEVRTGLLVMSEGVEVGHDGDGAALEDGVGLQGQGDEGDPGRRHRPGP